MASHVTRGEGARIDWRTPRALFEQLDKEFGFEIDVAASAENALCERFYDIAQDSLRQAWAPRVCWCNPPYGRGLARWVEKAAREARIGATVVMLIPAATDTRWWSAAESAGAEHRRIEGRLFFDDGDQAADFPSALLVFHPTQREQAIGAPIAAIGAPIGIHKRGGETIGTLVRGIRLPGDLLEDLDCYAEREGIKRAEAVRRWLAWGRERSAIEARRPPTVAGPTVRAPRRQDMPTGGA